MKKLYFIINPKAGNGKCMTIWKKIEAVLMSKQLAYLAFFTEYPGHATVLAKQIGQKNLEQTTIVAVGGDGTVHEVMNGIIHLKHISLGFIPGGSGNDFSRGFQIPANPEDALKVLIRLLKKDASLIDIGQFSLQDRPNHFFINNMGTGFDALISYEVNQSPMKALLNKLSMGRLVYVYFLLKKLFTYKTSTIDLSIDGHSHIFEHTWFVTVSNQPYYGGGMKIAPAAKTDDGVFDITVVHKLSKLKLLMVFLSVFSGKHIYFREVKTFKGKDISIQSSTSLFVHADGEHVGNTPLTIKLQPNALKVIKRTHCMEEVDLKERDSYDFQ